MKPWKATKEDKKELTSSRPWCSAVII
jgi:hypothetical protein